MIQDIQKLAEEIKYEQKVLEMMEKKKKEAGKQAIADASKALTIFKEAGVIPCSVVEEFQAGGRLLSSRTDAGWKLPEKESDFDPKSPLPSSEPTKKRGVRDPNGYYITTVGTIIEVYTVKAKYYYSQAQKKQREASLSSLPKLAVEAIPIFVRALLEKYKEWLVERTSGKALEQTNAGETTLVDTSPTNTVGRRLAL